MRRIASSFGTDADPRMFPRALGSIIDTIPGTQTKKSFEPVHWNDAKSMMEGVIKNKTSGMVMVKNSLVFCYSEI
jgi:hypothetical protein